MTSVITFENRLILFTKSHIKLKLFTDQKCGYFLAMKFELRQSYIGKDDRLD